jgi:hypothetical protein
MKTNTLSILSILIFTAASGLAQDQELPNPTQKQSLEERLLLHGFKDVDAVKRIILELKNAAQGKDKKALVGMVQYPFSTYDNGTLVKTYKDQNELLEQFDTVFSDGVMQALSKSTYESLFVRDLGAMIGNGEVWLSPVDNGIRIKAVNP